MRPLIITTLLTLLLSCLVGCTTGGTAAPTSTAIVVALSPSPSATLNLPTFTVTATATAIPTESPIPTGTTTPTVTTEPTGTATIPAAPTLPPPSPSPTIAPATVAAPTPTPLPATATLTPEPPSPTAIPESPTPVPPSPTATPPVGSFTLLSRRLLHISENGGCEGNHNAFVKVVDANGAPLNGVTVYMRWDTGEDVAQTGYKPEFPGGAVFDMYGGYNVGVRADANGTPAVAPETFVTSRSPTLPELLSAGYCSDMADCEYRNSQDPPQFCWGHYSYEVTYQRAQ